MHCQLEEPLVYTNPLHFIDEETEVELGKLSDSFSTILGVKSKAESKFSCLNSASPSVGEKI